jgi:DNA-binding XRE family transcriptional regulator
MTAVDHIEKRPVLLRWVDACDNHDDAIPYDEAASFGPLVVSSVGWLVALTKAYATIAQTLHIREHSARDLLTVPLGMVVELRPLWEGSEATVCVADGRRVNRLQYDEGVDRVPKVRGDDNPLRSIARRIKAERVRSGLSLSAAGRAVGCSRQTFLHVERGDARIRAEMLPALGQAFGCDPRWFLRDRPPCPGARDVADIDPMVEHGD